MANALANKGNDPEELVLRYIANPRPDLKDMIVVEYAPLVERTARRFAGIEPHADLVQIGYIGLLNALGKYDPNAGVKFPTYASHLIAGEIKHYLRDKTHAIRQPAWLQELRHKVTKAANRLTAELGRVPTDREVADEVGISENAVQEVMQTAELMKMTSLDSPFQESEDNDSDTERIETDDRACELRSTEERVLIEDALSQLRDLERDVIVLFHFESLNQTEIADRLGISCNYVSHVLRQSLGKLRKILNDQDREERIKIAASTPDESIDPETGVFTLSFFERRLREELHRVKSGRTSLAIIRLQFTGLDRLAMFYGPGSTQQFLADAAAYLKKSVRAGDAICRIDSHGFALLLPSVDTQAEAVCQRIEKRFKQWIASVSANNAGVSVALGRSIAPTDGKREQDLLDAATPLIVDRQEGEEAA